jgi:phosphopantetheinyl transferase (holo-ACP synthase)
VRESKVNTTSETPEARKTRITAEVEVLKTRIASEQDAMIKKILAKNLAVKEKSLKAPVVKIGVPDVLPANDNPGKNQADLNREKAKNISKLVREGAGA